LRRVNRVTMLTDWGGEEGVERDGGGEGKKERRGKKGRGRREGGEGGGILH